MHATSLYRECLCSSVCDSTLGTLLVPLCHDNYWYYIGNRQVSETWFLNKMLALPVSTALAKKAARNHKISNWCIFPSIGAMLIGFAVIEDYDPNYKTKLGAGIMSCAFTSLTVGITLGEIHKRQEKKAAVLYNEEIKKNAGNSEMRSSELLAQTFPFFQSELKFFLHRFVMRKKTFIGREFLVFFRIG